MKQIIQGLYKAAQSSGFKKGAAAFSAVVAGGCTLSYLAAYQVQSPSWKKSPQKTQLYDIGSKTYLESDQQRTPSKKVNVAVLGAAGGIGQPLSLLLKLNPMVGNLHIYDIVNTPGVAADLGHIDTGAKVKAFVGKDQLNDAVKGVDLVIIPAGVPRKPGMTRDDLFNINAGIVRQLITAVADNSPDAWIGIISNPVNSTVPIAAEVLKAKGKYDKTKVMGVTTLDVVRANTFWAEYCEVDPKEVTVPVVGGHAGQTILPILSFASPNKSISGDKQLAMMKRIQEAGTEVVEAKAGAGSATLSMAYAAVRFADSCMRAMLGEDDVIEFAYVESEVVKGLSYFAQPVKLGPNGIAEYYGIGHMDKVEQKNMEAMKNELAAQIQKGIDFAKK